jgi:hypothetical protein
MLRGYLLALAILLVNFFEAPLTRWKLTACLVGASKHITFSLLARLKERGVQVAPE